MGQTLKADPDTSALPKAAFYLGDGFPTRASRQEAFWRIRWAEKDLGYWGMKFKTEPVCQFLLAYTRCPLSSGPMGFSSASKGSM